MRHACVTLSLGVTAAELTASVRCRQLWAEPLRQIHQHKGDDLEFYR